MTAREDIRVSAREADRLVERRAAGATLLSAGGILAALGAASCCVVPFALFMLGVSGAWISNLTALEPYQPIFAAVTFGFLAGGFFLVYRKPKVACAEGTYCAKPDSGRVAKIGLWTATAVVVIALGFPKLAPLFL
ncbi:MAG TPA: mercuric transporter MerT family protein [Stellaceae bacterium]|nr:mercuric transporter MerT family protein [Stellaceae bacterium]